MIVLISLPLMEAVLQAITHESIYNSFPHFLKQRTLGIRIFLNTPGHTDFFWKERFINIPQEKDFLFSLHDIHPTRGWWPKPHLHMVFNRGTKGYHYTTNDSGHRTLQKNYEKKKTIMLIGDSFTFGVDLDDAYIWPAVLDSMLTETNIINLAVAGYGPDQMLVTLREEIDHIHPDLILVNFIAEDLMRSLLTFRDFAKPRFEYVNGKLVQTQKIPSSISEAREKIQSSIWRQRIIFQSKLIKLSYVLFKNINYQMSYSDINLKIFMAMNQVAHERGIPLVHVFLANTGENNIDDTGEKFLRQLEKQGSQVINTRPDITSNKDPRFQRYGHYGLHESRFVAGVIKREINKLFPELHK